MSFVFMSSKEDQDIYVCTGIVLLYAPTPSYHGVLCQYALRTGTHDLPLSIAWVIIVIGHHHVIDGH